MSIESTSCDQKNSERRTLSHVSWPVLAHHVPQWCVSAMTWGSFNEYQPWRALLLVTISFIHQFYMGSISSVYQHFLLGTKTAYLSVVGPSIISCCRVISDFSAATSFGGLKWSWRSNKLDYSINECVLKISSCSGAPFHTRLILDGICLARNYPSILR